MKKFIYFLSLFSVIYYCLISSVAFARTDALCDKFLRVHVIANSNTPYDQGIKLAVRDFLFKIHKDDFSAFESKDEALAYLSHNLKAFENEVNDYLLNSNCPYKAKLYLEKEFFPRKSYGKISLPEGNYNAFKIILGEGKGKNFFCVMFPPMCVSSSVISEVSLKKTITENEYKFLTNKYAFKIAELFTH